MRLPDRHLDLRNPDERGADAAPRPDALTTLQLPLDAAEDREFWELLRALDVAERLRAGGLGDAQIEADRDRLVGP